MASEEHDSWLSDVLGVAVDKFRSTAQAVEDDVAKAKDWAGQKIDEGKDVLNQAETWAKGEIDKGVDWAKTEAGKAKDAITKDAGALKTKALGDQSGKPVPRPMEPDCKPEHGYVPGPKNHLLCATHGHVIDVDQQMIIAESVAAYMKGAVSGGVSGNGTQTPTAPSPSNTPGAGQNDAGRTAPNIGSCVTEGAAFESACVTFAQMLTGATGTSIDTAAIMGALDAGGDKLVGWIAAAPQSGAPLATGFATLDAMGGLIQCMSQDNAADPTTLNQLKQRQAALDRSLASARGAGQSGSKS